MGQPGYPLLNYPGGATGLFMNLSQSPCSANASLCKNSGTQYYWNGAHGGTLGCMLYGVLETELMIISPPSGGSFFFVATFTYNTLTANTSTTYGIEASWNEIDQAGARSGLQPLHQARQSCSW